ncbi:YjgB family protein [Desulfosporosinus sp. Sb-LF]|uniref:YjgB family protein n=1 Tax=Desulfosporosinus sp. Sb-LF TaxID=2560027 RepID=UPI00107F38F9|nr:YjgB family protein [Desulfosporosinus sp. Sb-LF]TGE31010.1 DUF4309 domain-containing protein [Desulfosporosinus sp. Sb-LF]
MILSKTTMKTVSQWATVGLAFALVVGCSNPTAPQKPSNSSQTQTEPTPPTSPNTPTPSAPVTEPTDPAKKLLSNIMQLAQQGKVINCEFPANTTVIDDVKKKWGNPDRSDYVATANGTYDTYSKHNVAFGYNKGAQIFEVRSFESELKKLSLSQVKEVFGSPAYTTRANGEDIIGYTAGQEFKLLLVFPQATSTTADPTLDHYSVLYPRGTVNSMADDPGRQW